MTDIDEVSSKLGSMQTNITHILKTTESIHDSLKDVNERVIIQEQKAKSAHKRLDKIEPIVNGHENIKNKGVGFFVAVSSLAGVVGAAITRFIF